MVNFWPQIFRTPACILPLPASATPFPVTILWTLSWERSWTLWRPFFWHTPSAPLSSSCDPSDLSRLIFFGPPPRPLLIPPLNLFIRSIRTLTNGCVPGLAALAAFHNCDACVKLARCWVLVVVCFMRRYSLCFCLCDCVRTMRDTG